MGWFYLSPHFDDVVLSCGAMVWEQVQDGTPVSIWTVCAGSPRSEEPLSTFAQHLHARWGTGLEAVPVRRKEDELAVQRLGAQARYWDLPDCIYRRLPTGDSGSEPLWLINGEDDLWQPVDPREESVIERLCEWVVTGLSAEDVLVSPLSIGNHVDHRLVRAAAERSAGRVGCTLLYYPDYPYVARPDADWTGKTGENWQRECRDISPEALHAWQDSVACYASQMSTFFKDRADLDTQVAAYLQTGGGACLWRPVLL